MTAWNSFSTKEKQKKDKKDKKDQKERATENDYRGNVYGNWDNIFVCDIIPTSLQN